MLLMANEEACVTGAKLATHCYSGFLKKEIVVKSEDFHGQNEFSKAKKSCRRWILLVGTSVEEKL